MTRSRTLGRDESGAAAVEFALILPFLVVMYFGVVEFVSAFGAQRRAAQVASSVADIVAQQRTVTDATLADVFQAGVVVMSPYPTPALKQRVASLRADANGQVSVAWTANSNYSGAFAPTLPAGYLAANESVIVAEVRYDYVSPLQAVIPNTVQIRKFAYFRPRVASYVAKL